MCMSPYRGRESAFVSLSSWWSTRTSQPTNMPMINLQTSCSASSASTSIWHRIRPRPTTLSYMTSTLEIVAHRQHPVRETIRGSSRRRLATTTTTMLETTLPMRNKSSLGATRRIIRRASNNLTALTRDSVWLLKNRKNAKLCGLHRQLSLRINMITLCRIDQQRKTSLKAYGTKNLNIDSNNNHAPINIDTSDQYDGI